MSLTYVIWGNVLPRWRSVDGKQVQKRRCGRRNCGRRFQVSTSDAQGLFFFSKRVLAYTKRYNTCVIIVVVVDFGSWVQPTIFIKFGVN